MAKTEQLVATLFGNVFGTVLWIASTALNTTKNLHRFVKSKCAGFIDLKVKYWGHNLTASLSHFTKKYLYTINHKRIALNYLYFSILTGLSGAMLASFIRLELSYPGSHFFKGDSIRYIQVISAHGLVMIFYVVVPIIFGFFANYFIPYHILSKDVAFPRLNSIGFWILPAGFLMMSKPAFTRRQVYKVWDPYEAYQSVKKDLLKNFIEVMDSDFYKDSVEGLGLDANNAHNAYADLKGSTLDISNLASGWKQAHENLAISKSAIDFATASHIVKVFRGLRDNLYYSIITSTKIRNDFVSNFLNNLLTLKTNTRLDAVKASRYALLKKNFGEINIGLVTKFDNNVMLDSFKMLLTDNNLGCIKKLNDIHFNTLSKSTFRKTNVDFVPLSESTFALDLFKIIGSKNAVSLTENLPNTYRYVLFKRNYADFTVGIVPLPENTFATDLSKQLSSDSNLGCIKKLNDVYFSTLLRNDFTKPNLEFLPKFIDSSALNLFKAMITNSYLNPHEPLLNAHLFYKDIEATQFLRDTKELFGYLDPAVEMVMVSWYRYQYYLAIALRKIHRRAMFKEVFKKPRIISALQLENNFTYDLFKSFVTKSGVSRFGDLHGVYLNTLLRGIFVRPNFVLRSALENSFTFNLFKSLLNNKNVACAEKVRNIHRSILFKNTFTELNTKFVSLPENTFALDSFKSILVNNSPSFIENTKISYIKALVNKNFTGLKPALASTSTDGFALDKFKSLGRNKFLDDVEIQTDIRWDTFFVRNLSPSLSELLYPNFVANPRTLFWDLKNLGARKLSGYYPLPYNSGNIVNYLLKKNEGVIIENTNNLSMDSIMFSMQKQLKGRVASNGPNKLSIDNNWTDFLMLWEYNYHWYENPWQALKHALEDKTILMRNEKCSNPASVMAGWTFITPFSSQTRFTGFGAQDVAIVSVLFAGLSSTISFTNLLLTRRVLGAAGFKNRKNSIPFISISLFLVMRMLSLITPVLGAAMLMLLMDRHWRTSFFDYAYGGDSILFHHLFWFFGHPEVYVVIIPAFGIVNSFLPYYNKRRIASKNHLVWATYVMAYMGFLVWGHHMYLIGLDHRSRSFYSTITVMISLPAVVKIVNWTLTFLNGTLHVDIGLHFVTAFFLYFLSGGFTGLWLSHVALNLYVHDTFYVVAHFHFMFSCATFSALFAGIYFYYREFFGNKYSRFLAVPHFILWFFGQWITFLPLYWVGYNGLPRRYHDYPVMYMGWHGISSSGHMLTMFGIFFFLFGILKSKLTKRAIIPDQFGIPRTFKKAQYSLLKKSNLEFGKYNYRRYDILKVLDDIITR